MTPAVATWMLKELVENDAQHADLTDNLDWYILPVHNPDGYEYSRLPGNRGWRKSRRNAVPSANCTESEYVGITTE